MFDMWNVYYISGNLQRNVIFPYLIQQLKNDVFKINFPQNIPKWRDGNLGFSGMCIFQGEMYTFLGMYIFLRILDDTYQTPPKIILCSCICNVIVKA